MEGGAVNEAQAFEALLVAEVIAARRAGATTFSGVLRALAGADPPTLLGVLRRLAATHPWADELIAQAVGPTELPANESDDEHLLSLGLGVLPHPLDFDWRFTPDTVADLENFYRPLVPSSGTVLFLGTPSLFHSTLHHHGLSSMNRVLIDRNAPPAADLHSKQTLRAIRLDVRHAALPDDFRADVVLTDPPWYEQELRAFLWTAATLCRDGGTVAACLPGLTTRPGVDAERARLLDWTRRALSLNCLAVYPKRARYDTPPFERAAWRATGIRGIYADWRAGDLAVFRKEPGGNLAAVRPRGPWEPEWGSLRFGNVALRLRPDARADFADPCLRRLFPDDALPSVSRRDARRAKVDVWTSGNRVFACRGRAILERIGLALAHGGEPTPAVATFLGRPLAAREKTLVARAADQLLTLVECELRASPLQPAGR